MATSKPPVNLEYLAYLKVLDLDLLKGRISTFWHGQPTTDTPEALLDQIIGVISVPSPTGDTSTRLMTLANYAPGQVFWRVRRQSMGADTPPFSEMVRCKDAWEPPSGRTPQGRLNRAREPLLYTSVGDPGVAVLEGRVKPGDRFFLMKYKAVNPITGPWIAGPYDDLEFGELAEKHDALREFFEALFTLDEHHPNAYVVTERLARDWYDLPPHVQKAWTYPSVIGRSGVNAAFRPHDAHEYLSLVGVAACFLPSSWVPGDSFEPDRFAAIPNRPTSSFRWQENGSDVQRSIFPEFTAA